MAFIPGLWRGGTRGAMTSEFWWADRSKPFLNYNYMGAAYVESNYLMLPRTAPLNFQGKCRPYVCCKSRFYRPNINSEPCTSSVLELHCTALDFATPVVWSVEMDDVTEKLIGL